MRLSEFLEAWSNLFLQERGNRVVPGENSNPFRIDFRNRASPS
jgi:hypothetical protein